MGKLTDMANAVFAKISNFQKVLPPHSMPQDELQKWVDQLQAEIDLRPLAERTLGQKLAQRYAVKSSQISRRYFECGDIFKSMDQMKDFEIYGVSSEKPFGSDIHSRNNFFSDKAWTVFQKFYQTQTDPDARPDHLIHVTCTGYVSPSAAQRMVSQESWQTRTAITHAYHMGCYASLPAVRMANAFVAASPKQKIDIVHTEMCGLHMNPTANSPEQIVVQSLFADGHIKYSIQEASKPGAGLKILDIEELLIPNTESFMSWQPSSFGMVMTLAREVPETIRQNIRGFITSLFSKNSLSIADAKDMIFAIHPGGPRIIDVIKESLELSDQQVELSRKVLFERGNMSSATLPHVWEEIMASSPPTGTKVVSLAFGPGLTVFGALFEVA